MSSLRGRLGLVARAVCLAGLLGVSCGLLAPPEVQSVAARYQLRGRTERFFERAAQPRPASTGPKARAAEPRPEAPAAAAEGKTA